MKVRLPLRYVGHYVLDNNGVAVCAAASYKDNSSNVSMLSELVDMVNTIPGLHGEIARLKKNCGEMEPSSLYKTATKEQIKEFLTDEKRDAKDDFSWYQVDFLMSEEELRVAVHCRLEEFE